jgi:hypothetical protein
LNKPVEGPETEWRRLLRGGFAFQNAPFGSHPLDGQRAHKMMLYALRAGATRETILREAHAYLSEDLGLGSLGTGDQIARVEAFLRTFRLVKRKKAAWLVFWNSIPPPSQEPGREILTIIDSRKGVDRVREFVEQTYMASEYSVREKMLYSTRPKENPYPATIHSDPAARSTVITCGHNPWLEARFVRELRLERDRGGREILSWE